jgi:hypothetical protein
MSENSGNTFQIGLALAGAISAGAYTAGVLDFLFQALDEWEKERGKAGVPDHRVGLKVVAGASAGAITGALGAVALARGLHPQKLTTEELRNSHSKKGVQYQTLRCVLPSLHETWVTRPRVVAANGGIDFLSNEDLQSSDGRNGGSVLSVLNAKLLDEIKRGALSGGNGAAPYGSASLSVYCRTTACLYDGFEPARYSVHSRLRQQHLRNADAR